MERKPVTVRDPGADYEIRIVGDRPPLRDFYHALLELPWWATISTISGAFLAANALFALAYLLVGGVEHAARGSFRDAFFFSVQTMGRTHYRLLDLQLVRAQALSLSRSWNLLHPIDDTSPLRGETPASLAAKEIELQVLVIGLDDISMQTVHAGHRYFAKDILWGARLADVLSETPDGHLLLDPLSARQRLINPPNRTHALPSKRTSWTCLMG